MYKALFNKRWLPTCRRSRLWGRVRHRQRATRVWYIWKHIVGCVSLKQFIYRLYRRAHVTPLRPTPTHFAGGRLRELRRDDSDDSDDRDGRLDLRGGLGTAGRSSSLSLWVSPSPGCVVGVVSRYCSGRNPAEPVLVRIQFSRITVGRCRCHEHTAAEPSWPHRRLVYTPTQATSMQKNMYRGAVVDAARCGTH